MELIKSSQTKGGFPEVAVLRVAIFDLDQTIWNSEPLYACVGGDEASSPVADRLRSAGLSPRSWSQFIQKHSDLTQLYEGIAGSLANLQRKGSG